MGGRWVKIWKVSVLKTWIGDSEWNDECHIFFLLTFENFPIESWWFFWLDWPEFLWIKVMVRAEGRYFQRLQRTTLDTQNSNEKCKNRKIWRLQLSNFSLLDFLENISLLLFRLVPQSRPVPLTICA